MNNRFKVLLVVLLCHLTLFRIECEEVGTKKYNLSVCAVFKNEAVHLKEWIEYHRLAGVDHFYLYNVGSTDRFRKVLLPYIQDNIITYIDWSYNIPFPEKEDNAYLWALGIQVPAYENALNFRAAKETKWLVFLEINEFLVSPYATKLTEVLDRYDSFPGVTLSCKYYDGSRVDVLPRRKLVIESFELTNAPSIHPHKEISKTIFKPDLCKGFTWPPYKCKFRNQLEDVKISKYELCINQYVNRNRDYFFREFKRKLTVDNRLLSDDEMKELLTLNYEIEDQDPVISRYVPELLKKMGYDSGWGN